VWDIVSHKVRSEFDIPTHKHTARSDDGKWLALWIPDNAEEPATLRDVLSQKERELCRGVSSAAFSRDGRSLFLACAPEASGAMKGQAATCLIQAWETDTGKPSTRFPGYDSPPIAMALAADGTELATTDARQISIWDLLSGKRLGVLTTSTEDVASLEFSPDGMTLVSQGRGLSLWDLTTFEALGAPLRMKGSGIAAFSPDGTRLLWSGNNPPTLMSLDLNAESWKTRACNIAGRNLTHEEWKHNFGKLPYTPLCPKLPIGEDPSAMEARWRSAVRRLAGSLRDKQTNEAIAAYKEALTYKPAFKISARLLNGLCWEGSVHHYAAEVLGVCTQAVLVGDDNTDYHDSRGVARALTGDTKGAIEDFEVFVEHSGRDKELISQRRRWIEALQKGQNPFTEDLLRQIESQ
jgi:hypothetical protein